MFSEREMVASLVSRFPSYIGDDAALLTGADSLSWVITKDLLAEGVHFRTRYFSPKDLAHKALQVNLSDIAAMGGQAYFVWRQYSCRVGRVWAAFFGIPGSAVSDSRDRVGGGGYDPILPRLFYQCDSFGSCAGRSG